jgi:hypothetical protein
MLSPGASENPVATTRDLRVARLGPPSDKAAFATQVSKIFCTITASGLCPSFSSKYCTVISYWPAGPGKTAVASPGGVPAHPTRLIKAPPLAADEVSFEYRVSVIASASIVRTCPRVPLGTEGAVTVIDFVAVAVWPAPVTVNVTLYVPAVL